jgi:hypothetical protein
VRGKAGTKSDVLQREQLAAWFGAVQQIPNTVIAACLQIILEPVGLANRRLQIDPSGPFFTVFLAHSLAMGLQIRQKLASLGPIFAFDAPSPTGC